MPLYPWVVASARASRTDPRSAQRRRHRVGGAQPPPHRPRMATDLGGEPDGEDRHDAGREGESADSRIPLGDDPRRIPEDRSPSTPWPDTLNSLLKNSPGAAFDTKKLRCEARDEGRSATAQRGAGAPPGMRPRSEMRARRLRGRGHRLRGRIHPLRGPNLLRPPARHYDAEERNNADGQLWCKPAWGAAFRAVAPRSVGRGAPAGGSASAGDATAERAHPRLRCARSEARRFGGASRKASAAATRGSFRGSLTALPSRC